jgi:chemosensory pili system protein ChpA (sensor histidine kinase/response regulator)
MQNYRILIADDEADVQMLLGLFLERQGYSIIRARDGVEAIQAASEHLPHLIMLDIQMPRKTGIDAIRELRADERFSDTPILALTAYARNYLPSDLITAGFNKIIFKPFDFLEIEAWINQIRHQH